MVGRMMNRLAPLLLCLGLLACGGNKSAPATPTDDTDDTAATGGTVAADGPTCADVGVNAKLHLGEAGMPADKLDQAVEVLTSSCTEDAWSAEARTCVAESNADDMETCSTPRWRRSSTSSYG